MAKLNLKMTEAMPSSNSNPESKFTIETMNAHFTPQVYQRLKANSEILVQYWRSVLVWGRETKQGMLDGTTHKQEHGFIGWGYVCLKDQNLRIISLGKLGWVFGKEKPIKADFSPLFSQVSQ